MDLHDCAERSPVFSFRLECDFETCTIVHTHSMRKQHLFIFNMAAAWSVLQIQRVSAAQRPLLFNDLGKALNPCDIPMVIVLDFTKFRIPPPLPFKLEKISGIFPYPEAENLHINPSPCILQHILLVRLGSYP